MQRRGHRPPACPHAGAHPPRTCSWGCPPHDPQAGDPPGDPCSALPSGEEDDELGLRGGNPADLPPREPLPGGTLGEGLQVRVGWGSGVGGAWGSALCCVRRSNIRQCLPSAGLGPGRGSAEFWFCPHPPWVAGDGICRLSHVLTPGRDPPARGKAVRGASSLGWSRGHLVRQQEVPCPRVPRVHSQTRGREDDSAHPAWGLGLKGHSEVQAGCLAFSRLGS